MAKIITMPKLSDTMEEGGLTNWLVAEGDKIEEGEALAEIETDKATMEFPSPETGFLLKILVTKGSIVALGQPIAVIGKKDETFNLEDSISKNSLQLQEEKQDEIIKTDKNLIKTTQPDMNQPPNIHKRSKASPIAKKIASEHHLDIEKIEGSGPKGRVIIKDVKEYITKNSIKDLSN